MHKITLCFLSICQDLLALADDIVIVGLPYLLESFKLLINLIDCHHKIDIFLLKHLNDPMIGLRTDKNIRVLFNQNIPK